MPVLSCALRAVRLFPIRERNPGRLGTLSLIPEGAEVQIAPGACPIAGMMKVEYQGASYGVFAIDFRDATAESEMLVRAS